MIVVLDQGRIVEQGSHDKLLAAGDLYARIFRAQSRVATVATEPVKEAVK
jgi:ABC-type multidrug transport system fused ATPase/permease subunit